MVNEERRISIERVVRHRTDAHRGFEFRHVTDGEGGPIPPAPTGETSGFTLVEIVMALLLLSVGILGLAATTGFVIRQTELSAVTTERATVRQSVVESLQARDLADVTGGSTTTGSFQVTWRVTETTPLYRTVQVVTTGPGLQSNGGGPPRLAAAVSDTYTFRVVDLRP